MNTESIESGRTPAQAWSNAATHARNLAGDALHSVTQALDQGRANCAAQLDSGRDAVVDYVRAKPLTTIGIAALAGIALGLLLFRRQA
jgi:ElaB/YqjD/DUF883 family membrane-anchored ribosome-binding protein